MKTFDQFMIDWLGKRVADPLLGNDHPYQCVSLVKKGLEEMDGIDIHNSWWGNAIDYWTKPNPAVLRFYTPLVVEIVNKGDVVILRTNGKSPGDFSGEGHIGYATGNQNATQFELLEQNGSTGNGDGQGGDIIRTRWVDKSRIAGVLRHVMQTPAYTIIAEYAPAKWVSINKPTYRWNLAYRDFQTMSEHAMAPITPPNNFKVVQLVRHINGNDYYMDNPNEASGFNVKDCNDYTPPAPPAAPAPFPAVKTYELVTTVMTYASAADAKARNKHVTTCDKGTYILLKEDEQARQLVRKNTDQVSFWVNDFDNKEPEVVATPTPVKEPTIPDHEPIVVQDEGWKATTLLFEDGQPVRLTSTNSIKVPIKALDGKLPEIIWLPPHKELDIIAMFEKGGVIYYQDTTLRTNLRFYALPTTLFPDPYKPLDYNHNGEITISDFIDYGMKVGNRLFKSGTAVINTALKAIPTKKFIDGVHAAKTKEGTKR